MRANTKARLNLEFARRSRDIRKTQEAIENKAKRFVNTAKADQDARYAVMDIGMRHGLRTFKAF